MRSIRYGVQFFLWQRTVLFAFAAGPTDHLWDVLEQCWSTETLRKVDYDGSVGDEGEVKDCAMTIHGMTQVADLARLLLLLKWKGNGLLDMYDVLSYVISLVVHFDM